MTASKFLALILLLAATAHATTTLSSTSNQPNNQGFGDVYDRFEMQQDVIMNGALAEKKDAAHQFTVFLQMFGTDKSHWSNCTGMLIRKDMILTAGHCFSPETVEVKVNFGLKAPFQSLTSRQFRYHKPYSGPPGPSLWVNGQLPFDIDQRDDYEREMRARTDWVNYKDVARVHFDKFADFALIKISGVPVGYKPVDIYKGTPTYNSEVYGAGYGTNSRVRSEVSQVLRWSRFNVVGHFTKDGDMTAGWQVYSPTQQQACFGDSGGPLFIRDGRTVKLMGINLFTYNNCANENWYLNPNYYENAIQADMNSLRSEGVI